MEDHRGFTPEPNCGRGTATIIYACLTTIFLSTWTSVHIDVTPTHHLRARLRQTLYCLLLPEALAVNAVQDLVAARALRTALRRLPNPGWDHWTLTQAFLVIRGGVVLLRGGADARTLLTAPGLLQAARTRAVDPGQFPDDVAIGHRAKAEWTAKAIALAQALWVAAQLVSRLAAGMHVAPLEDVAAAYVLCGLVMFGAWFACPQDVHECFEVEARVDKGLAPGEEGEGEGKREWEGRWGPMGMRQVTDAERWVLLGVAVGAFVGVHVAAWNYPFPTVGEAWAWRGCSLAGGVLGMLWVKFFNTRADKPLEVAYVACRLALVVLAIIAFRWAPASVYEKPSWSMYWAHIGS